MKHAGVRHGLVVVAGIVLLVAFINLLSGGTSLLVAVIAAAIVIALLLIEVWHYRSEMHSGRGAWHGETKEGHHRPH